MKLRTTPDGLIAHDAERDRWVLIEGEGDLVAFLAEGAPARERALQSLADEHAVDVDPAGAGLPFRPRSMRAFMLWESHVIGSARMLVKHFFPTPAWKAVNAVEKLTNWPLLPVVRGIGHTPLPRPERLYFWFGEPIATTGRTPQDVRDEGKAAIEGGIAFLHGERENDPNRGLLPRLRRRLDE